jgi:hypothetical protein
MRDTYLRKRIRSGVPFKINQILSELVLRGNDGAQSSGKVKRAIIAFKIAAFVERDNDGGSTTNVEASSQMSEECYAKKRQSKFLEHVENKDVDEGLKASGSKRNLAVVL